MTRLTTRSGRSISISSLSTESNISDTDYIVPMPGTYVVVQLDPVQMVTPLDDTELTAAAVQLQPKKYVGYIHEVHELTLPDNPDHKCCIEMVGKGLCQEDKDALVDGTMCTPVFPATEHPLSRAPLRPKPSFPFSDCYHYTFATPIVRIPTKNHSLANAITLPEHDFMADSLYVCEDRRARRTLRRTREQQSHSSSSQTECESPSHSFPGTAQPTGAAGVERYKLTADSNRDGATDSTIRKPAATDLLDLTRPSPSPSGGVRHSAQPRSRVHSAPSKRGEEHGVDASDSVILHPPEMHTAKAGSSRPVLSLETQVPGLIEETKASATPVEWTSQDQPNPEVEMLNQFFRPYHLEDRDMIPLVDISVDLSQVSDVDDPLEFLREIEHIQWLIKDARNRWPRTLEAMQEAGPMQGDIKSWVALAKDSELVGGRDRATEFKRRKFNVVKDKYKARARQVRHRCAALLHVPAKTFAAFPFRLRVTVTG